MLRNRLKTLTAPFHDELEYNSIPKKIIDKTISQGEYIGLLSCFYKILKPIEENIVRYSDRFGSYALSIERRGKVCFLENDLIALGYDLPIVERRADMTFEETVGGMYVFEGATMGGLRLNAELEKIDFAKDAHSYFLPYGAATMAMWQEYCGFLDRLDGERGFDADECVLSACRTFLGIGSKTRA